MKADWEGMKADWPALVAREPKARAQLLDFTWVNMFGSSMVTLIE
jgi:hypothetical protein